MALQSPIAAGPPNGFAPGNGFTQLHSNHSNVSSDLFLQQRPRGLLTRVVIRQNVLTRRQGRIVHVNSKNELRQKSPVFEGFLLHPALLLRLHHNELPSCCWKEMVFIGVSMFSAATIIQRDKNSAVMQGSKIKGARRIMWPLVGPGSHGMRHVPVQLNGRCVCVDERCVRNDLDTTQCTASSAASCVASSYTVLLRAAGVDQA